MTVRHWEDGMLLSIKDVKKIARALGCSPEDILDFDVKQDPDETTEEQNIAVSTWSWTWHILGMLLGTATAISIIKNGFAIDLYGLPAKVLAQYHWLRDTLLVPVVWAVRYFGIEIAWWVKDMIMAYALFAAAHARAYQLLIRKRLVDPDWSLYLNILLWPKLTWRVLRDLVEARGDREYFNRYGFEKYYTQRFSVENADYAIAFASRELRYIGLQLVLISVATMAFFTWNYLSGLYGAT
jgi:hypothetical protein